MRINLEVPLHFLVCGAVSELKGDRVRFWALTNWVRVGAQ